MQFIYDPFVLRRAAGGRIFFVNSMMPFEYFINCFQAEQPFFLVSQLEDGRVAITPNVTFIPFNPLQAGYWPQNLLPYEWEYVTMKNGTYPLIISAHPVTKFDEWFRKFEACVTPFAKKTLAEFVATSPEFLPLELGHKFEKFEQQRRTMEPVNA